MANIVNARDVRLQAYSPRVATVAISKNLVVSQDQVTGLGLIIAGTKMLFLEATSQVFQIAKTGTVSPASTTLKANLKNISSTPVLTVVAGTIMPTPTFSNGSVIIPYESMMTDAVLLRLTAVQDGVTYTDEITIVKVREGIDGLIGFLTNEAHTVAADYLGNVLSYTSAGGSFRVFQGVNDITSLCSFSIPAGGNTNALTASINASTGVYSVIGGYPTNTELAVLLLKATFGTVTLDKVFTLAKTKAGAPGTNGKNGTTGVDGRRGSRTFYITLTGTTAVYSDTLATTTASADGGPVLNDVVTQYNTSQGFSQTKFYTAGGWVVVNAVVDGNLIVSGTIGATQIQTNLLNTDNILTRGLTVRDTSGNIILSSGTNLDYTKVGGSKPPSNATVGATFGYDIAGRITADTASTYIADAAIVNAQIGTLDAQKINTGYLNADRIRAGTIEADKINARGLSILDSAGGVILSAGTAIQNQINPYSSGATVGAVFGVNVGGQITASTASTFIGDLTINTLQIAGNAVTVPVTDTVSSNHAGGGDAYYHTIFVPMTHPGKLFATATIMQSYSSGPIPAWQLSLFINNSSVYETGTVSAAFQQSATASGGLTVPSGSIPVTLVWRGGSNLVKINLSSLYAVGAMK